MAGRANIVMMRRCEIRGIEIVAEVCARKQVREFSGVVKEFQSSHGVKRNALADGQRASQAESAGV